jgi:hypothetical protein
MLPVYSVTYLPGCSPLLGRRPLFLGSDRFRTQSLGEAHGTPGDLAGVGPVQADLPTVVRPVEVYLLIADQFTLNMVDRRRMQRCRKS